MDLRFGDDVSYIHARKIYMIILVKLNPSSIVIGFRRNKR